MRKKDIRSAFSGVRAPEQLYDKILQRTKPRYKLRPGLIIAYTLFVGALCFVLGGAAQNKPLQEASLTIDYTMQAALITADGQVTESLQITVQGSIYGDKDKQPQLELAIVTPDSFRYRYHTPDEGIATSISGVYDDLPYYVWLVYGYDTKSDKAIFSSCAMSVEKEFLIIDWDDGEDLYLVAAADPTEDFASVLEYFEDYMKLYSFS